VETITIQGVSQNTPPQWSVDTLKKTTTVGTQLFQALSDICTDAELDRITYTLLPGVPDNDTIIGSAYQFNPTVQNVGTFVAQIKASDPVGSFSILPVKIIVNNGSEDKQPPEITFVTPSDTSATVAVDSFTIDLLCTDASGVASVSAALGTTTFQSNLKNGHYLISVKGFTKETMNIVTITATDSTAAGNTNTRKLYFNYTTSTPPFTITYNGNTNTAGAPPVDPGKYEIGATVTVKDNTGNMVKVGYTFTGWNTAADGSGATYAPGVAFPIGTANVTLFAQWTTKPTFTVTYNGNGNTGGTVPVDVSKYETAATVTVKENTGLLAKTGSTFAGWNSKADGGGTSYAAGVSFPMGNANVTLYAQWTTKPTFTVTYDGNGNTGGFVPTDTIKYETAVTVIVKENTGVLLKTGSAFSGWNTAANGSGTAYAAGVTFPMGSANVMLYAQWTIKPTFTVAYVGNGNTEGTTPADTNKYETAATVTVKENVGLLVKTGSTFAGWNTKADGSGNAYAAGITFPMGSANVTLYAQWTKAQYTITYYGNGNTGGTLPSKTTHLFQTEIIIASAGNLTKTGYSYVSWNTDSTGNGLDYYEGNKITIENNIKLYARWSKDKYKITYAGNGDRALGVPNITEYEYGSKIDSATVVPSRLSYIFNGWFKDQLCTEKWKYGIDSVISTDTLFAKWVIRDIDGNIYSEVTVGNQVWMVENLKTTKFNDGTAIPIVVDSASWVNTTSQAYCWYNNDMNSFKKYGALYNWFSVSTGKLAPTGWHVPTNKEWDDLENFLIANGNNWDGTVSGNKIAKSLAAKTTWANDPTPGAPGNVLASNNNSGFSALAGGSRDVEGFFSSKDTTCSWWSSTVWDSHPDTYAWFRYLANSYESLGKDGCANNSGNSIRLIRD
jgi:uncharacterized protein (TIGR02145 family)/uncharacterized repeat protein (TIGR02543 family)